ncbi:hypothetical protein GGI26_005025 [Coemansia sp. RSA 1358]|uniref:CUE domain-containing protein n=1 Tax=Coemansia umbellata TaxID=1424467 RepID=A0ABQ8PHF6_9FUNG|nr:hypothetical protein EDC05_004732 [Coemansia umbellata]KAJ2620383.1 hypothetical protein GGI26_005025 [Coemansia sp. RSA 1358]
MMTDDSTEYEASLKSLQELFPDMDKEVIDMVLRNNGGAVGPNVVNILLGMNDPSFKPEEQDETRVEEVERDAEYARRLAESEIYAREQRYMRMSSAPAAPQRPLQHPPNQQQYQQQHQQQQQQQTPKKASKIRTMLRLGRRSNSTSQPVEETHSDGAASHIRRPQTLESDFSDSSEDNQAGGMVASIRQQPQANSNSNSNSNNNIINKNILDDASSNLSLYAPLNPSKYTATNRPAKADSSEDIVFSDLDAEQPVRIRAVDGVDLEHPFESNPLSHPTADTTNPFAVPAATTNNNNSSHNNGAVNGSVAADLANIAISDTNPFRNRQHTT